MAGPAPGPLLLRGKPVRPWPGHHLQIARQALGERFDVALENGSITLGMLREAVERWIADPD